MWGYPFFCLTFFCLVGLAPEPMIKALKSIRASQLDPLAAMEVPNNGRLFHKGVVNSLMGD